MDANTQERTLRVCFSAYTERLDTAARLVADHGFSVDGSRSNYLQKKADTTFLDAMMYCGSLRGVPGIDSVTMMVLETQDMGDGEAQ